jgi:hypothetical protein
MNEEEKRIEIAMKMLREDPSAGEGWQVGNSVAGSLLNLTHGVPRQYAEPIVGEALRRLRTEDRGKRRKRS